MSEEFLFGLKGSTDWSLPADWREVSRKFDAALDLIEYCFADFDRMENLKVSDLGDVIAAVEFCGETLAGCVHHERRLHHDGVLGHVSPVPG